MRKRNNDLGFAFALVALVVMGLFCIPDEDRGGVCLSLSVTMPASRSLPGMSLGSPLLDLHIDHSFEVDLENILQRHVNLDSLAISAGPFDLSGEIPRFNLPAISAFPADSSVISLVEKETGASNKAMVTHVVHPGECLWTISKAYSVPISTIMNKNGLGKEIILVGQELKIPIGELSEDIIADSAGGLVFEMGRSTMPFSGNGNAPYGWPVKGPCWISSSFGRRFHPIYRKYKFHNGIDIAGRHGSPIVASADGEVVFSGFKAYSGKVVYIKHTTGDLVTIYAHCSKLLVKKGARVKAGQAIAKMGRTGRVTGIHLHFAVMKGKKYLDPVKFIGENENTTLSRKKNNIVLLGG